MAISVDSAPASVSDPVALISYMLFFFFQIIPFTKSMNNSLKDLGFKLMALEKRLEEMDKKYQSLLDSTKQSTKESKETDRDSTKLEA